MDYNPAGRGPRPHWHTGHPPTHTSPHQHENVALSSGSTVTNSQQRAVPSRRDRLLPGGCSRLKTTAAHCGLPWRGQQAAWQSNTGQTPVAGRNSRQSQKHRPDQRAVRLAVPAAQCSRPAQSTLQALEPFQQTEARHRARQQHPSLFTGSTPICTASWNPSQRDGNTHNPFSQRLLLPTQSSTPSHRQIARQLPHLPESH